MNSSGLLTRWIDAEGARRIMVEAGSLEQEIGSAGESVIIRIKSNAYTLTSSGCGTWKKVG
jgi:hypothetical protein